MRAEDVTDLDIEEISRDVGYDSLGWDGADPKELVAAACNQMDIEKRDRVSDILDPAGELTADELVKRAERWRDLIMRAGERADATVVRGSLAGSGAGEPSVGRWSGNDIKDGLSKEWRSILKSQRKASARK